MIQLTPKTIQRLVVLINEETTYRSGPMLVALFNEVGFHDVYGRGFPSRGTFTEEHLKLINGREELERIIRRVFNPREFSECPEKFTACVDSFNAELRFDGWNIYWDEGLNDISFRRVRPAEAMSSITRRKIVVETEDDFLKKEFKDITFDGLISIPSVQTIIEARLVELKHCLDVNAPLSAIFLTGSILEAVLLSISTSNPRLFCGGGIIAKRQGW